MQMVSTPSNFCYRFNFEKNYDHRLVYYLKILFLQPEKRKTSNMKKEIHPKDYRFVVFQDMSNGYTFMSKSTANTKETIKFEDGKEYPLIKLEISHTSHPFFTGKMKLVDTAGRVDKFKTKYAKHFESKTKQE
jgi:large subunit ribosomal protein L31